VLVGVGGGVVGFAREHPAVTVVLAVGLVAGLVWLARRLRRRRFRKLQTLGNLLALTPTGFELAVADLYRALGYRRVEQVGKAGDLGADVVCRDPAGRSVVIQCKRYSPGHRVGSKDIQHFIGMVSVHHRADHGIFVTTSDYTDAATDLAKMHRLELVDGGGLARRVEQVQDNKATASDPGSAAVGTGSS
jgi:restriction system protein